jgi:hypothetical protein
MKLRSVTASPNLIFAPSPLSTFCKLNLLIKREMATLRSVEYFMTFNADFKIAIILRLSSGTSLVCY